MRSRLMLPAMLALTIAAPAIAQDTYGPLGDQVGKFTGSGEGQLTAEIAHIEGDIYSVSLSTTVPYENGFPGCGGGISGEMIMDQNGGNFFVENEFFETDLPESPVNSRVCEIGFSFESGFLVTEERAGCMAYHGASCGFSGEFVHENAIN